MNCPFCSSLTKIFNSRSTQKHSQTWRRHRCIACQRKFTTRERIDWNSAISVVNEAGILSPYSREILLSSLIKALEPLNKPATAVFDLLDTLELQLQSKKSFVASPQSTTTISLEILDVLRRYDPNSALQYLNNLYTGQPPLELIKRYVTA